MKLVCVKSDCLPDWFVIEKFERPEDRREWFENTGPYTMSFCVSSRLSNADCEGTRREMIDIAEAIKGRSSTTHKRCAVDATGEAVLFWSPRNSGDELEPVPYEDALALAEEILAGEPAQ